MTFPLSSLSDPRPPGAWEKDAGPLPEFPALTADAEADAAIIGAGITGVAVALALRELRPEWRVALLDSHRPGSGASSRSSGHLVAEYHAWPAMLKKQGPTAVQGWNDFSRRARETLIEFIRARGLACELRPEPLILVGEARERAAVEKLLVQRQAAGLGGRLVAGAELQEKTGSAFYAAGIELADNYLVQPARLMRGLIEAAVAAGVAVYGATPVTAWSPGGWGITLRTPAASISARRVLFAANAYLCRMGKLFSRRLVPVHVACVATRPLRADEAGRAPEWRNLKEVRLLSRTIGGTRSGRIFLRGIFGYQWGNRTVWPDDPKNFGRLERELRARLPWLEGMEIAERWSAPVAMNIAGRPLAGELGPAGGFGCAGYNGVGLVDGFYHARLVAHRMAGAEHPDLGRLFGWRGSGWIPPEPWRGLGARTFFFFGL